MPSVMDAVKTALKYLFKKLYAFGIFAIEARSTAWPGISRFTCITLPPLRRLRSPAQQTADKQRSRGSP
ncbi:hypothetical protein SLS61_010001 [Didymella pomorum]